MPPWLRRARASLVLAVAWAVVWGPAAVLLGLFVDPHGAMDEMWIAVGAIPGFLGGLAFSLVLGFAARRRRFEELSLAHVGAWGAVAGLVVGILPFSIAESASGRPLWSLGLVILGTIALLSAGSAVASLALARLAERRGMPDAVGRPPTGRRA
jgi:hypothetical protein